MNQAGSNNPDTEPISVLVVDDSHLLRRALQTIFARCPDFEVVGEAKNGIDAVEKYKELNPDVVTMDITMREMDGFAAAKEILAYDQNAQIIFLSNLDEDKYSEDAKRLGARGYVNKHKAKDIIDLINSGP